MYMTLHQFTLQKKMIVEKKYGFKTCDHDEKSIHALHAVVILQCVVLTYNEQNALQE